MIQFKKKGVPLIATSLALYIGLSGRLLFADTAPIDAGSTNQGVPAGSGAAANSGAVANSASPVQLASTVVTGTADVLVPESPVAAAADLSNIPGGASFISSDTVEQARVSTAADVLALQPGVYAQSTGGQDAIRISIRGSGLNRGTGFFRSGALFLFDGLPVTGPGGTPFELFEPLGLNYVEVLRGANAFDFGALALGGAIDYVSNTGISSPGSELRIEAGSFGYFKEQLSYGGVHGNFDYYASVTDSDREGYQHHSHSRSSHFEANFGYRISPNIEDRAYVRYGYTNFSNPGALTRAQLDADPTQAVASALTANSNRIQPGSTWIGNKTTIKVDPNSTLEVDEVFHNYPIIIDGNNRSNWWQDDVTGRVKYTRTDDILAGPSVTTIALDSTTQVNGGVKDYSYTNYAQAPANYHGAPIGFYTLLKEANYDGSADNVLVVSNDTEAVRNLWFTTGLQLIQEVRESQITYSLFAPQGTVPADLPPYYSQAHSYLVPRVGARYELAKGIEVYANFSGSVEPESAWSFSGGSTATQNYNLDILPARAVTAEFGTQGDAGISHWSVSYYHSDLRDEILTAVISPPNVQPAISTEENASPTTHQGVEAELDTLLWQDGGVTGPKQGIDPTKRRVTFEQAYTWSDFHYNNDPVYGRNRLPGIPENFYQAELRYDDPSGLYVSANVQLASGYPIDYADTFYAQPSTVLGATIGYAPAKKGWKAYLDLRNLTDRHYVASVSPIFNAHGADAAAFYPGDGFGVFGGFSYQF
jgi:iron complex outermembrane receptor protein